MVTKTDIERLFNKMVELAEECEILFRKIEYGYDDGQEEMAEPLCDAADHISEAARCIEEWV